MDQSEVSVLQGVHVTNQQGWPVGFESHGILAVPFILPGLEVQ